MSALPLQSESLGDFEATPDLDAHLSALANRAKTDPAARNALYQALGFKIARFIRRYRFRRYRLAICDLEDVSQEAFLVFCDVVESWPGQESFLGYFFSRFPWRLARAIDVLERGWSGSRLLPLANLGEPTPSLDPADFFTLAEVGANLQPRDRAVLELHIGLGLRLNEVARVLGVHPRTVSRAWGRIVEELRHAWCEATPPTQTKASRRTSPKRSSKG